MHRHAGIAEHGLGPGGGDGDVFRSRCPRSSGCSSGCRSGCRWGCRSPGLPGQGVAQVVELAVLLLIFHFQVGQGGGAARAPVDDALVAINQSLAVEVDKGGAHRLGRPGVQGKAQARPVAGGAQPLVLLIDGITVAGDPFPNPFLKLFPAQFLAAGTLFRQQAFHHPLGSDTGVVFAGQPQGSVAGHPPPAGQGVLDAGGEGVAQVQLPGDIGRRHDDGVGRLAGDYLRGEIALAEPVLVDALFHIGGAISPGDIGRRICGHRSFLLPG